MNFVRIDKYIHQYDFPTSKFLIPWKDRIEKHFFENVHPETGVYNVPNAFDEIEEFIQSIADEVGLSAERIDN